MQMKRLAGFFVHRHMYVNGKFRFNVASVTKIPHTNLCVVSGGKNDAFIIPKEDLSNNCYSKDMVVALANEYGWTETCAHVKFT